VARAPDAKLRVLLAIKSLGLGGAERLLVDTVTTGDRQRFEYEVAYVLESEGALAPTIVAAGIPTHSLGAGGNWDLRWMARLRALLVDGGFDIVHFHLPYTAALGRLVVASIPSGRRPVIVYTEHSLWNKAAIVVRPLNRITIGLDRSLIVVSQAAYDALPPGLQGRARVIVHGVDLSASGSLVARRDQIRTEVRSELEVPDRDTLVTTVANLRPEKGYDVLLDAAHILADRGLPVTFVAVGQGPLDAEVRERHRQLGLGRRFRLLGQRHDVLRLLTGSDIFVLASRQEGLPVVLMEATSVGLPIVATDVGGVTQVVTDGADGIIVPPGRSDDLADALERLVTDPDLRHRLGDAALVKNSMFDVTNATRKIEDIYVSIVG
jgi:glycosyltransferase involved in cell wall biosynthesis